MFCYIINKQIIKLLKLRNFDCYYYEAEDEVEDDTQIITSEIIGIINHKFPDFSYMKGLKKVTILECNPEQFSDFNVINSLDITTLIISKCINTENYIIDVTCKSLKKLLIRDIGINFNSVTNLTKLTKLTLINTKLTDAKNINNLVNLRRLTISENKLLTEINVDKLVNIVELKLQFNSLKHLDINNLYKLFNLDVSDNSLDDIKLNKCSNLIYMNLNNNRLKKINLNGLSKLEFIDMKDNLITNISVRSLKKLRGLIVSRNRLTKLNIKNLNNLVIVNADGNKLSEINFGPNLLFLDISFNKFTKIDESFNTLKHLYAIYNQIEHVNINSSLLLELILEGNKIKTLNVNAINLIKLNLYNVLTDNITMNELLKGLIIENLEQLYVKSSEFDDKISLSNVNNPDKEITVFNITQD